MPPAQLARCLDCGAELVGPHCHRCGQGAVDRRRPLRALVSDALGDFFSFDSRLLRTLGPLFLRPGFLTAEWVRGRRTRYVPPLRLYVFTAAIFFFVLSATQAPIVRIDLGEPDGPRAAVAPLAVEEPAEGAGGGGFGARLTAAIGDDLPGFQEDVVDALATFALVLAPASGLLLGILYRRRFLVEHVVFAVHFHVFAFALLSAQLVVERGEDHPVADAIVLVLLVAYLFLALRRAYGGRWWATALRVPAFGALYGLLILLPTLLLAFLWTVYRG